MQYWSDKNQIILISKDAILFGHFSNEYVMSIKEDLKKNIIPSQLTGIPINYIKSIQFCEGDKKIIIEKGKGREELTFKDVRVINDIFNCIREEFLFLKEKKPDSKNIWKRFARHLLVLLFALIGLTFLKDYLSNQGGMTLGGNAIGGFLKGISESFTADKIIMGLVFILLILVFILINDINKLKKTRVLWKQ